MRKFTLILALIAVIGMGSVFAADSDANLPTIWVWTQMNAIIASDDDASYMATGWGASPYYSAGLYWANDKAGFTASLEGYAYDIPPKFREFVVYYKFMDGMVKTTVGKVRDGDYRFTDYINDDGMMSRLTGSSVEVKVTPAEGFNFTVQLPVGDDSNLGSAWNSPASPIDQSDAFGSMGFGASYLVPDLAKFIVGAKLNSVSGDDYDYVYFAADVSAVENAGIRAVYTNTPDYNKIGLTAKYGMDPLSFAGEFYFTSPDSGDSSYTVEGGVYYAMGDSLGAMMIPGVEVTLSDDGTDSDITIYPNVNFDFGGGSSIEFGVSIVTGDNDYWSVPVQAIFYF